MTLEMLEARVSEIERELALMKARLSREANAPIKTFRDLYGVFPNEPDLTMQDFEDAKIKMNWDKFKDI